MLTINNPNDAEKRQNVVPLTMKEEDLFVSCIQDCFDSIDIDTTTEQEMFQRFIHNYENLKHFYAVAGGWDGLEKLKSFTAISNNFCTSEIKVNYEIVKCKDHE